MTTTTSAGALASCSGSGRSGSRWPSAPARPAAARAAGISGPSSAASVMEAATCTATASAAASVTTCPAAFQVASSGRLAGIGTVWAIVWSFLSLGTRCESPAIRPRDREATARGKVARWVVSASRRKTDKAGIRAGSGPVAGDRDLRSPGGARGLRLSGHAARPLRRCSSNRDFPCTGDGIAGSRPACVRVRGDGPLSSVRCTTGCPCSTSGCRRTPGRHQGPAGPAEARYRTRCTGPPPAAGGGCAAWPPMLPPGPGED